MKIKKFLKINFKAGILSSISFAFFYLLLFLIQKQTNNSNLIKILLIPLIIISLPLIIIITNLGFIINPSKGYETMITSKIGIIISIIFAFIYYFFIGVLIKRIIGKKDKNKKIIYKRSNKK